MRMGRTMGFYIREEGLRREKKKVARTCRCPSHDIQKAGPYNLTAVLQLGRSKSYFFDPEVYFHIIYNFQQDQIQIAHSGGAQFCPGLVAARHFAMKKSFFFFLSRISMHRLLQHELD